MDFFNKEPHSRTEWQENTTQLQVTMGFFSEMIKDSVRAGVLLGLNDAFGNR